MRTGGAWRGVGVGCASIDVTHVRPVLGDRGAAS